MLSVDRARAAAPPRAPTLEWIAPPECPSAATLERILAATLGVDDGQEHPSGPQLRARALVHAKPAGGWVLDLQLQRGQSQRSRRIEAETCEGLASAAVLVVAIAFDPLRSPPDAIDLVQAPPLPTVVPPEPAADAGSTTHPAPDPTPPTSAATDPRVRDSPEPTAPKTDRGSAPEFSVRLLTGLGLRVLPRPTALFELSAAVAGRSWRAELGADTWVPVRASIGAGLQARFGVTAARMRACGVLRPGPRVLSIPICGAVEAGTRTGRGVSGFSTRKRAAQAWVATRGGMSVVWRVHTRASLWVGGELILRLLAPGFGTDDADNLVSPPRVGGVVTGGLEIHLGRPKD